jgi:hypothetical protein
VFVVASPCAATWTVLPAAATLGTLTATPAVTTWVTCPAGAALVVPEVICIHDVAGLSPSLQHITHTQPSVSNVTHVTPRLSVTHQDC